MSKRVVGIDPAPKKAATIYDPANQTNEGWSTVEAHNLPGYIRGIADSNDDLLICWDAPLTASQCGYEGCYYERPIEGFFRSAQGYAAPKGISVRAYAGCPHWAVTRASLGLPRTGDWDRPFCELPFCLCAGGERPAGKGNHIVEVHPAVAIWLWCRDLNLQSWFYKGKSKKAQIVRKILWEAIKRLCGEDIPNRAPKGDDEFDAYVAFLLGSKWLFNQGVVLLGDAKTGSFLVPASDSLQNAFNSFIAISTGITSGRLGTINESDGTENRRIHRCSYPPRALSFSSRRGEKG